MNVVERQKASRFGYIDCVRGVAALYVMIQHTFEHAGFVVAQPGVEYRWPLNFGESGVFAFFVVSGFIIPVSLERAKSSVDFWRRRIARIYPLYLSIFLATVLITIFVKGDPIVRPVITFLAQLLFLNSWIHLPNYVGGSWTLVIEFLWYIGIFTWWRLHGGLQSERLILLAVLVAFAIGAFAIFSPIRLPLGRLGMILACVWGLMILEHSRGNSSRNEYAVLTAAMAATTFFLLFVGFKLRPSENEEMMPYLMVMASWTLGCLTFFFFSFFRDSPLICNRPLMYLGTISYSVYLLHSPILDVGKTYGLVGWPLVFVGICTTVLLASLTYKFIELPFIRVSHTRRARGDLAGAADSASG